MSEFNPLLNYVHHILGGSLLTLRPPSGGIFSSNEGTKEGGVLSVILDRQGQFQTELFTVPPHIKEIRSHKHPGVDSYEFHVAGDFTFIIEGVDFPVKNDGGPMALKEALQEVKAKAWHGGKFTEGGSFLSFQYWLDCAPSTVGDSFVEESPRPALPPPHTCAI